MKNFKNFLFLFGLIVSTAANASTSGAISGTATDEQGIAVDGAQVQVVNSSNKVIGKATSGAAGDFEVFPVDFGNYTVQVDAPGFSTFKTDVHVASGGSAQVIAQLTASGGSKANKEITIKVQAKKNLVSGTSPSSTREVDKEMIQQLPQGDDVKLPKLIATTTPGVIQGPFGQTFIRGNHANIQYQIDGVQLPDSPSNTFGEAFSPRNIDHMEVITGGIPAEYGERLSAVVNIITKTGTETPGGVVEMGYGAYNTLTPQANYSGTTASGNLHYYFSAAYTKTDRGLDVPQAPTLTAAGNPNTDPVHDASNANDEFIKLDWQASNDDKITLIGYNSYNFFQIPNFPASYGPTSPMFNQGYSDQFGNGPLNYVPSNTDDTQAETNSYVQLVWKHTFDPHAFLQVAPYFKYSRIKITNDPTNDLYAANAGAIAGSNPSSFTEDKSTNNLGLKSDFTDRFNDRNLFKAGFQVQQSKSTGPLTVISQQEGNAPVTSSDNSSDTGYLESVYIQDDFTITKPLVLSAGIRADATQYKFSDISTSDGWVEPRIGLSYLLTETTKLHVFYGLLFQPAPVENLRDTFVNSGAGNELTPYDIKAEKDNYYEVGIAQQVGPQVLTLNAYYKKAKNMLDDSQLLNTSIAQPYNFADGYAYGVEFSVNGKITDEWSDYFNYSYEIAKGNGISGGLFSFPAGTSPSTGGYQYLDHVQVHSANAGVTYKKDSWWWTGQGLFGSGLRTGDNNTESLPSHLTMDTSIGYDFTRDSWLSRTKVSLDILNLFNEMYPITIANGYNGSHYAAGRELYIRVVKEI